MNLVIDDEPQYLARRAVLTDLLELGNKFSIKPFQVKSIAVGYTREHGWI